MSLNNFLAELKRRNVYKIAIAYGVVAWLLIQIASQIFPFFDIPSWAVRLVILLLIIGFPIALIFSWAFEMTPAGIKRTEDVAPGGAITRGTGRKLDLLIIGVLLAVITILIFRGVHPHVSPSASSIPKKSIAVLPFENLSANQENAYFANGVQNEILTNLAKIADLKVISHTSVMQYKSGIARNLREIGQQLGVAHLLEGSVQRDGGKVRVNVQLIDARTDAHLWAQTDDRDLADVFAIQSEIAKAIADQLQAKLSLSEIAAIEERPTNDLVAYDLHVHAISLIDEASYYGLNTEKNLFQAVELLNQAITRDPAFLLAYCKLAEAHDGIYWNDIDHTPRRLELANAAINSAFDRGRIRARHTSPWLCIFTTATAITTTRGTSLPSRSAECPTTHESLNGVDTSIEDRGAGMKPSATSCRQWSWIRKTVTSSSGPHSLIFVCANINKPERFLIAALPLNQRTITYGYFLVGSTSMSKPIPNHGMPLSKGSSRTTPRHRWI